MTKGKKQPSKRESVLKAWERIEERNTPDEVFLRLVLFVERNSPQWRRKPRRSNDEVNFDRVRELERQGLVQTMKGTQQ